MTLPKNGSWNSNCAAQWRGNTALTLPFFWRRSTVSPVFFGRYPQSSLHSFVLPPSPSLISNVASVDVKQFGQAGWPIIFSFRGLTREAALPKTNAVKRHVEDLEGGGGNEGEWTGKVEIRTRKKFLAVGEANLAIDWLIDDHLYSAILRSLEQTHCARLWFYMSD